MQVYRELAVLTARPSQAEMQRAPHSSLRHGSRQRALLRRPLPRGRGARAARCERRRDACRSSSAAPASISRRSPKGSPRSPTCRRRFARIGARKPRGSARRDCIVRLQARDPVMAARLRPSDPQRLLRALEVIDATSVSLAEWQGADAAAVLHPQGLLRIVIAPEREAALCGDRCALRPHDRARRHRGGAGASRARSRSRSSRRCGRMACASLPLISRATAASKRRSKRRRPRAAAMPSGR